MGVEQAGPLHQGGPGRDGGPIWGLEEGNSLESAVVPPAWRNVTPQEILRRAGKTFSFANRFFPENVRDDVARLYGFCRIADDLADDESIPLDERRRALDRLERWLDDAYRNGDPGPSAVSNLFLRYSVPLYLAHDLLLGVRSDLEFQRYERFDELRTYCYRVASTVGLMLCHVWGVKSTDALERAEALGVAMQLTNIARDVGEDFRRNRVYLPAEWLDGASLDPKSLGAADLRPVLERTIETADRNYALGLSGVSYLPKYARFPVQVAAYAYRDIHTRIRANGYDVVNRRAATGLARKLWIAARVAMKIPPQLPRV